ncbi:hypothetical protein MAR_030756 [Mya arenaria]|uniref:Zinc-ribbon domain-containing protein n=1 Tax=Mya arenaria TaxID=6604 RepID=A0ABY7F1U1_MYAAR|nr:hypothetical protein MAR_030756 [Mya arenaria]
MRQFCTGCGKIVDKEWSFCGFCGCRKADQVQEAKKPGPVVNHLGAGPHFEKATHAWFHSTTLASEPSFPACSKYDYDEKVLEKMVRMEFSFEILVEKVEQNWKNIKDEKERLHAVNDVMKDQQEQAERRLVSLMEEVKKNQSRTLEKVVIDSNNRLEQMNAAFNKIQG